MGEIEQQVQILADRVTRLERENAELRAQLGRDDATNTTPARLDRRGLLRLGGVAAAVGAGSVLIRPGTAGAAAGDPINQGQDHNAGATRTSLTSSVATETMLVQNSGNGGALTAEITADPAPGDGPAAIFGSGVHGGGVVGATTGSGPGVGGVGGVATGPGVVAAVFDDDAAGLALEVGHLGTGTATYTHIENPTNANRAMWAQTVGTGNAVYGRILHTNSTAAAVAGTTDGKGPGINGTSAGGVGGRFTGKTAQVQLVPTTASTHPASGSAGQLYVDRSKRLWYCKGGTSWKQLA
jgi:hypothetical protein